MTTTELGLPQSVVEQAIHPTEAANRAVFFDQDETSVALHEMGEVGQPDIQTEIHEAWGPRKYHTLWTAATNTGVPDVPAWLETKYRLERGE